MTFYQGEPLQDGEVALCQVNLMDVLSAKKSSDHRDSIDEAARAEDAREDGVYFGISFEGATVGGIRLHDWDRQRRTSLVGYNVFEQARRGRGIGKRALRLLQRFVVEQTDILQLVALTTDDNVASQRICLSNGFVHVGPSREDPEHGVALRWIVERLIAENDKRTSS